MKAHIEDDGAACIFCPGCKEVHVLDAQRWTFSGDLEKPTFSPSLLCRKGHYATGQSVADCHICQNEPSLACSVCHTFITDGNIQFLGDCTHALAGQTVEIPEWRGFDPERYAA